MTRTRTRRKTCVRTYPSTANNNDIAVTFRDRSPLLKFQSGNADCEVDSCLALNYVLNLFNYVMTDLNVYPERMRENLELTKGLVFSQRVLLAMIDKGLSRQEAYKKVQRNAMRCWSEKIPFLELLKGDAEVTTALPPTELEGLFDYNYYLEHVDEIFERLG